MKKVCLGLSVACLLVDVFGTIEDVISGTPFWLSLIHIYRTQAIVSE